MPTLLKTCHPGSGLMALLPEQNPTSESQVFWWLSGPAFARGRLVFLRDLFRVLFVSFNSHVNGNVGLELDLLSLFVFEFVFDTNFSIEVFRSGDGNFRLLRLLRDLNDFADHAGL